jgi:hypothetical protein
MNTTLVAVAIVLLITASTLLAISLVARKGPDDE